MLLRLRALVGLRRIRTDLRACAFRAAAGMGGGDRGPSAVAPAPSPEELPAAPPPDGVLREEASVAAGAPAALTADWLPLCSPNPPFPPPLAPPLPWLSLF